MQRYCNYYCSGVLALLLAVIASSDVRSVGVEAFRPIHPRCSPPKTTAIITMHLGSGVRSSGRSPSRAASHTATQQWDRHLDLARNAHRKRHFHQVRELCSRVISIAEDWSAVEQAHLRLALAEQKAKRVEAARRAFQRGTAACPSSDTLFMAWGLMESKMYEARSKKVANALLRRAVALNPRRHANVLKWGILFDLKKAGEAAMEAMYSELSHGQAVISPPFKAWSTPLAAPINATEGAVEVSYSTGGIFSIRGEAIRVGSGESRGSRSRNSCQGWFKTTDSAASSAATPPSPFLHPSPSPGQALEFVSRVGEKWSKEREDALAADILDLCQTSGDDPAKDCATSAVNSSLQNRPGSVVKRSAKFQEVLLQLEKAGKGVVDTGNGNERALGGTWQLVFTTCTTCDRVITQAGSDVYERLTPPITEIAPRPSEPPVPFMCEVLVQPSRDVSRRSISGDAKPRAPSTAFFRGWANVSRRDSGRVLLRQQVAPRPAKSVVRGGPTSPRPITCKSSPTAVFSALGQVPRATKGLEKLVTQEVTYVGSRLRIGRTKGGDVYVYKRCAWPEEQ